MEKVWIVSIFLKFYFVFTKADSIKDNKTECETDWLKYNQSCYFFSDIKSDWITANDICKTSGSNLVSVETKDEHSWLKSRLDTRRTSFDDDHYISGSSLAGDTLDWLWEATSERICLPTQIGCFEMWGEAEPGLNDEERCLQMGAYDEWRWHDGRCDEINYFICEKSTNDE